MKEIQAQEEKKKGRSSGEAGKREMEKKNLTSLFRRRRASTYCSFQATYRNSNINENIVIQ